MQSGENQVDEILEVVWYDSVHDKDVVELFTDFGEAQERVREIREKYKQSPRIWRRSDYGN
jgi:hypothetical protein